MRPVRTLAMLAATVAVAGCGATPPQVPSHQVKKLAAATNDISTECGFTYEVTAFPGNHSKQVANLESLAKTSARSLAAVYRRNPAWIYQGETIGQIVTDALAMLHSCGLPEAERTLLRETSH